LPPLTGAMSAKEEGADRILPPSDARALLFSAQQLMQGLQVLARSPENVPLACSFLAGQALEGTLKAYLSLNGVSEGALISQFRHDLEKLWNEAVRLGAPLSATPSRWCQTLNTLHGSPYYLRYPLRVNIIVMPAKEPMVSELQQIVDDILALVKG
jgi:hypothetical protein